MRTIKVVIVEDDIRISAIQSRFVAKVTGFEVIGIANTLDEAHDIISVLKPDLVLLDVYFPDGNGIDFLWKIRKTYKNIDVILITAAKEVETLQSAMRGGVFDYILKPVMFNRFKETLLRYNKHCAKIQQFDVLEQEDVDFVMHPKNQTMPIINKTTKGIDTITLNLVKTEITTLNDKGISAEAIGVKLGMSLTTARRYLEFLVSKNIIYPKLTYGTVGRPERMYFKIN